MILKYNLSPFKNYLKTKITKEKKKLLMSMVQLQFHTYVYNRIKQIYKKKVCHGEIYLENIPLL